MKFKIIVLGANGLTGKLVIEHLLKVDALLRGKDGQRGWAVAGRNRSRIEEAFRDASVTDVEILQADLEDDASLKALSKKAEVILNLAGPYTPHAEKLIAACVDAGASYVDLSGEIPLLKRVIERFEEKAKKNRVQIVQMCGWEAFPADLTSLIACRKAMQLEDSTTETSAYGLGVASPIRDVTVLIKTQNDFKNRLSLGQQVSAGTLASIVQILEDPEASLIGFEESLVPKLFSTIDRQKKIEIKPFEFEGRVYGPVVPVPFLNPPIIRRTAFLLSQKNGVAYQPATYREGNDLGLAGTSSVSPLPSKAKLSSRIQILLSKVTLLPLPFRKVAAQGFKKILPPSGSGPSGEFLRNWSWTVEAVAATTSGKTASCTLKGNGHPGYTSTAAMIVEVGLHIALNQSAGRLDGCITPSLAVTAGVAKLYLNDLQLEA